MLSTSTSTLPSPTVLTAPNLNTGPSSAAAAGALTGSPSAYSPSVAVDPINPLKMVATWIDHDAAGYNRGNFVAPVTSYAQGAYSTNGGVSWTAFPSGFGPFSVNVQENFALARPTNGTVNVFTQTTDATIAFDRNENVYVLTSTHDTPGASGASTAGVLDLQRFSFSGGSLSGPNLLTQVYAWDQADSSSNSAVADAAVVPTMAVDTNLASFTDPATGAIQTDPYTGNVYVSWAEVDANTYGVIPGFNPNTIRMTTSSNQGASFTHAAYVDNSSNANGHVDGQTTNPPSSPPLHDSISRYSAPQIAISQGNATTPGGQVTIVYDDYGANNSVNADRIIVQTNTLGGDSEQFSAPASATGPFNGTIDPAAGLTIPILVNIANPKFTSLQALDVSLSIAYPTLADVGARIVPNAAVNAFLAARFPAGSPNAYPGYITLFNGGFGGGDGTVNTPANLGSTANGTATAPVFGAVGGTVFDQEAIRSINDGNVGGTAVGHFRASGNAYILALQGLSGSVLSSTSASDPWNLVVNINGTPDTSTNPRYVNAVSLNFSSGNNPGSVLGDAGAEKVVVDANSLFLVPVPNINPTNPTAATAPSYRTVTHTANRFSPLYDGVLGTAVRGSGTVVAPVQGTAILPAPAIASDNTLGSFGGHQGRIYVTFTGMFSNAQAGNTDVFLSYSDDFGATWSSPRQVNDDNAATDGYSGSTPGGPLGRAQYESLVAVDQSTGDLVLSFLDARNDPSNARVATYVAASADGGATFAADVYGNPTQTALDAVTGNAVNLGPVPDNQSGVSGVQDPFAYGAHQALAVSNGRIVPFWASNQNSTSRLKVVDSIMGLAAGPRVIASSQGPVGVSGDAVNATRSADGTTLANTIQITFDRPIDPSSYAAIQNNTRVYFKAPSGGTSISLPVTGVAAVNGVGNAGATVFNITFNPGGLASFVGTYSYVITPTGIVDQVRQGVSGARGTVMDQNANGTPGQLPGDDYVVGQPTGFGSYATGTLPLIVSGPHVLSTAAVASSNNAYTVVGTGANDLVLNSTVAGLQVLFDRNIQVGSLLAKDAGGLYTQILSILGPAGVVPLTGITITPLSVFASGSQVAYAGGATANLFRITFATQQISGTYTLSLGTGILGGDGSGVDSNLNAGLDTLRGTATNGITVPVTYASTVSAANPATIAAGTANIDGSVTPSTLSVPIVVPDNFPVQGDSGTISGITLTLSITYPNDPDLVAYLVSPPDSNGNTHQVNLFTNVGAGTTTANFTNTTFSDAANISIRQANAPFFGTFSPESPFSNVVTQSAATGAIQSTQGTWTLVVKNGGGSAGALTGYSLTFRKPVSATGLAEFPNDQTTVSFQVFNLAPTNPLANSTWTAVGPAGITTSANGKGTVAGTVATIAVDPSDTTGNTVFVGTASGGIWKTTNFLTTNAGGPTYIPLTDFGPSFSLNIGSITVFGRNNDPAQSIVFAGTGFGQERANNTAGNPNVDFNTGIGGGMLRSMDGGKTWAVVGPFAGQATYKVIVDPSPNLNGQAIVYAATTGGFYKSLDSGNNWTRLRAGNATDIILDPASKSPTTGNLDRLYVAFSNTRAFTVTPYDYSNDPVGVYVSTNGGQTLQAVNGLLGKDPLLVTTGFPAQPLPVGNPVSPNNTNSAYIVLAKPALTSNTAVNLNYEGWLYAAVENYNGTFQGLYVTKDAGDNWTLVQLPNIPGTGSVKAAVPTNATDNTTSYDPTSSRFAQQGLYNLTLTVDPTNPNLVYLGGSQDFQQSGLIRVNLTNLFDAHNFTSFSNNRSDGGLLRNGSTLATPTAASQGGVFVTNPTLGPATYVPIGSPQQSNILNLRYAPNNGTPGTSPFLINSTLVINNGGAGFVNDGTGVTWSLFDEPLKANAGDVTGSTNLHAVIDYVDPITGAVRMLYADDLGVFTALVNPDGTLNNGIGSDAEPNYSRNGNLQNEQFFRSAAQPSKASATTAGAEFYASGQSTIAAQSDANVLTNGNLVWDNSSVLSPGSTSPRNTVANSSIDSSDRGGVGIATDQTGASTSLYEFDIPILGGNLTDFFRVDQFGQTTGLVSNVNREFPANGYRGDAHQGGVLINNVTNVAPGINGAIVNGQIPEGDFAVNPLNGNQILISSASGNLYETTNKGILWTLIGNANDFGASDNIIQAQNTIFQGRIGRVNPLPIQVSAIAYGAPDPNVSGGVGNLNNFIYAGTSGNSYSPSSITANPADPYRNSKDGLLYNDGRIFVTQAGGQGWTDISAGLDGSSVVGIYPDPNRGSHAAYAVTLTGVFYTPDSIRSGWTNITSNLASIQRDPFGNAAYRQSVLAGFSYTPINPLNNSTPPDYYNVAPAPVYNTVYNSPYGGFTGVVADYRYQIPAATNATQGTNIFYPVLYTSGYGGVFRSIDNGATWTVFPNTDFDAAPVDGGYLPNVDVTDLQLVLGNIDPNTGHAFQSAGDPEVLLASTFGRGDFAIRLAPNIIPDSVHFDQSLPAPNGSDSGSSNSDFITNVTQPYIDGISETSNFFFDSNNLLHGTKVDVTLYDESPTSPLYDPTFLRPLGTATTNQLGQFVVQLGLFNSDGSVKDPYFLTSSTAFNDKILGIRATDNSGASGNVRLISYTLDLITPNTPQAPALEATYDTGRFNNDDLTNLSVPAQAGPGAPLTLATPIFDVTTPLPQANPLTPNSIGLTVELLRATDPNGPFFLIDSTQTGFINAGGASETYMLMDADAAAQAAAGINATFYYEALQVDAAGNVSTPASNVLTVTINTITPPAPTGISLVTRSNTTPPHPVFSVTGVLPNDQVLLYRSIDGGTPIQVGAGPINGTNAAATLQVTDTAGATPDGVYTYYTAQLDVYGNYSPLTAGLVVTINTQAAPLTPVLEAAYDTGRFNNDDKTNIAVPAPTPGSSPNFVAPVFDITTVAPPAGQPDITTVQLFRSDSPNGPFVLVGTAAFNGNPAMLTDVSLQALASSGPINQTFYYEADDINAAGLESNLSPALAVVVDTITPPTLPTPTLDPASNTGLVKSQLITNITKPTIDVANLLPGEQVQLFRSTAGKAPIRVDNGQGPINNTNAPINTTVADLVGAVPDGVYQYFVVQQDVFGNISNFSMPVTVTINTTRPTTPTIKLVDSDDSGLPSHPNVTNVRTPHFSGTAQYNAGTNFPLEILNLATGQVLGSTFPSANGTYLAQITSPLADGVYTLVARTTNLAGTYSYSAGLTITIKGIGPMIPPTLQILPADDTGIKGDGVTSNHNPRFTGTTDTGDTVSLYALINGQLQGPLATATSSTLNGSFTFKLPFNLSDGTTQLVARTSDIANNQGPYSAPFTFRITSTAGDYLGNGGAQLTVFDPFSETYYVQNVGAVKVDATAGRDVPIQYDINGDGITDLNAYRYNTAEYYGYVSNNTINNQQFGPANAGLPVSGYFGGSGTYLYGSYIPTSGTWAIALPQPGGLVVSFGVPRVDIPTPAAFDGSGSTELAVFRPTPIIGNDADSFTVLGPKGQYLVSFTNPAIPVAARANYVYKAGDVPAPADYDGIGKDEFAIYRPTTGQFFVLSTPNVSNAATWTIRAFALNLPGGPNANDVPVSQDYDGNGKVDFAAYRPSNSTFYLIHSSTGLQQNIAFGAPNQFVAAAGPLLYRLTALKGAYATTGGYLTGSGGGAGGSGVHSLSIGSGTATASPSSSPLSTTIALATPIAVTTPTAPVPTTAAATPQYAVTIGTSTPKGFAPAVAASKPTAAVAAHHVNVGKVAKPIVVNSKAHHAQATADHAKALKVATATHPTAPAKSHATAPAKAAGKAHATAGAMAAASLQHLVMAAKGRKKS